MRNGKILAENSPNYLIQKYSQNVNLKFNTIENCILTKFIEIV